jgi:hypothetical protein
VVSLLDHDSKFTFGKNCRLCFIDGLNRHIITGAALVAHEEKQ